MVCCEAVKRSAILATARLLVACAAGEALAKGKHEFLFVSKAYAVSLYLSATVITTTGYGDILPTDAQEICTFLPRDAL